MLPCFRCGAPAIGTDGVCANCGMRAFASPYAMPAAMQPRRDVKGLGLALMIMLGVTAAALVAVVAAQARRHQVLSQLIDSLNGTGDRPDLSTVQSSDDLVRVTNVLMVIAFLATGVLTICWLYAARTNAETYGPYAFNLGRGWAIGGWFIPIGAMFLPLRVALETHRGTVGGRQPSGGSITGWWWGFWLAGNIVLVGGFGRGGARENDLDDPLHKLHGMQTTSAAVEPGFLLLTVAAILMLFYVRKITKMQVARAGEPYGGGLPPAYGMPPGYGGPPMYGAPTQAGYGPAPYGMPTQTGYGPAPYGVPQPPYGAPPQGPYPAPTNDAVPPQPPQ